MKAFRILFTALAVFVSGSIAAQAQDNSGKKAKTETVVFNVSMNCHNCQAKLEKNIPFEKGVKDMTVDLETKTVTIKFDPKKNTAEGLRKAIEKLSFSCQPIPAGDAAKSGIVEPPRL